MTYVVRVGYLPAGVTIVSRDNRGLYEEYPCRVNLTVEGVPRFVEPYMGARINLGKVICGGGRHANVLEFEGDLGGAARHVCVKENKGETSTWDDGP